MKAALVLLAACASQPTTISSQATATTPPPPSGPPPSIEWIDNGFDTHQLPAISADGARVVYATPDPTDPDHFRPSLSIRIVDRANHPVERIPVLALDEVSASFDEHGMKANLRARIDGANQRLAELHRSAAWSALQPATAVPVRLPCLADETWSDAARRLALYRCGWEFGVVGW